MELFNKKTDVLDIKLTPYGQKLYSIGKFQPVYYSFHDDDILYDRTYIGLEENRKYDALNSAISSQFGNYSIDKRISDSISFKVQPTKYSVEDDVEGVNKNLKENLTSLYSFVGSGKFASQYFPAFDIKLYRGNLTGTISYTTGSGGYTTRYPQIYIEVTDIYDQESKTIKTDEYLLIRVRELNSLFEKENFEIEFYEIDDSSQKKQLYFLDEEFTSQDLNPQFFNDVPTNEQLEEGVSDLNDSSIDYFFNILLDRDILNDLIYESNPELPEVSEIIEGIKNC